MIGFVVKDFYVLKQGLKTYLLLLGLYAVMTFTGMFQPSLLCGVMGMMIMMLPISSFSYDDMARWDKYAASMPVGRKGIVQSKYVFTLCITAMALVAGILLCAILVALKIAEEVLGELIVVNLYCVLIGLIFNAILTPFIFKFGAEKSRILMFVIFAAVFGGIAVAGRIATGSLSWIGNALSDPGFMIAAAAVTMIAFIVSYFISYGIYGKKDL